MIYNAALLTIHAVAAERGYTAGPARNDERARLIAARLSESPPFFAGRRLPNPDTMFHTPGWVGDLDTLDSPMDKAIDPKVAEALTAAWRARAALGLDPLLVQRLADCVDAVARGPFFRYPYVRLNQINWNAELYACAATVTGTPELLQLDYRRHVRRFVGGARRPLHQHGARNLSNSYRFQYQTTSAASRKNVDSAEYANMTLHFIAFYEQALQAGMPPLPEADMALLRAWAARVQFGYWTHSGLLSWDSGLGFTRWMKAKTWAYALQGPLAIACSPRFHLDPRQGPWAKYVFDRGLTQFAERCEELKPRHLPSAHLFDVGSRLPGQGQPAAVRRPHGRERDAGDRPRARRDAGRGAAARLLVRRRRRAAERQHSAATPPRSSSTTAARSRTAGSTSRGSSTRAGRRSAASAGGPPASFGVIVRGAGHRRRVLASQRPASRASLC